MNCNCRRRVLKGSLAALISGTVFIITPKCPMCIASWIAIMGGLTITFQDALLARSIILILSVLTFSIAMFRLLYLLKTR